MTPELIAAIIGSVAKIGLEATALLLERLNKPGATVQDAIDACREVEGTPLLKGSTRT